MNNETEIKVCIREIGRATILFKDNTKDYVFNGMEPRELPSDYYTKLYNTFESNLIIYIIEKATIESLNKLKSLTKKVINELKLSGDNHRVDFLLSKKKNELSEEATTTHDDINAIISTQKLVLNKILIKLYEELISLNPESIKDEVLQENIKETETSNIPFPDSGKATFKMGKKEALMFLYILEKEELLQFENEIQRRRFIENNFNYTEIRENKTNFEEACEMKGVGKELSNFTAYTEAETNNKTLEKLLKRLNNTIHLYEFKK